MRAHAGTSAIAQSSSANKIQATIFGYVSHESVSHTFAGFIIVRFSHCTSTFASVLCLCACNRSESGNTAHRTGSSRHSLISHSKLFIRSEWIELKLMLRLRVELFNNDSIQRNYFVYKIYK